MRLQDVSFEGLPPTYEQMPLLALHCKRLKQDDSQGAFKGRSWKLGDIARLVKARSSFAWPPLIEASVSACSLFLAFRFQRDDA
jgi:hypothetical protein